MAITITLNGVEVSGHPGMSILDLARESGVHIPTLCHDPHLKPYGACRICLVENEQNGALLASCVAPIAPGMVINTRSEKVLESRRTIVKMMLASHPDTCMVCDKGNRCQLRQIAADLGVAWVDFHRIPHSAEIQDLNPFIERDMSKCILCAKCIRADQELVCEGAIDYFGRGFTSRPATVGDTPLELSNCTFCGTCVSLCPTGALAEKIRTYHGSATRVVCSTCGFCACGCNIEFEVSGGQLVRARPGAGDTPNGATLCVRGAYGYDFIHNPLRLTVPLIKKDGELQPATWEEALALVAETLGAIKSEHGAESLAVLGSSKCTNEDNYILQRFAREVLETPHLDNGASLYMSSAREALRDTLGYAASTGPFSDLEQAEVILMVGSDSVTTAPQVSYAVKRAVKYSGARLILISPVDDSLDHLARIILRPLPGTEAILLNSLARAILDLGIWHKSFVAERTAGFDSWSESLEDSAPAKCGEVTGISSGEVIEAGRMIAQARGAALVFGSGIGRREGGGDIVRSLINLALLTGNVGHAGGGVFILLEENNAQGAADMGCLPEYRPGYQKITETPGLSLPEMVEGSRSGNIRGMYIMGENPVGAMPVEVVKESLESLEFLVVQDIFLTETASLASVVLPAAGFAEKEGTFTNFDRRVQTVRPAVDPPGESLPDWQIIQRLSEAMGNRMGYSAAAEITDDIARNVPLYQGINAADIPVGGVSWPRSNGSRVGTRRLYEAESGSEPGRFVPVSFEILAGQVENPVSGSVVERLCRFGSGVRSSMSPRLSAIAADVEG